MAALKRMFVDQVQGSRIKAGQCRALRPAFLKLHGVVHGVFRVRDDVPEPLRVGLFKDGGREYPTWARFSADTRPRGRTSPPAGSPNTARTSPATSGA